MKANCQTHLIASDGRSMFCIWRSPGIADTDCAAFRTQIPAA